MSTIFGGGRHQRREGFNRDAEKYREAVKLGYRVLRYTSDDMKQRPLQCVEEVAAVLTKLTGENQPDRRSRQRTWTKATMGENAEKAGAT